MTPAQIKKLTDAENAKIDARRKEALAEFKAAAKLSKPQIKALAAARAARGRTPLADTVHAARRKEREAAREARRAARGRGK